MNVATVNVLVESIEAMRDVVSQLPPWVPVLVYAIWFIGIVYAICVMHIKVRRVSKAVKNATSAGQPPLALPSDVHPAVLAVVSGDKNCLISAFTATVQRLAAEGYFVSNKESERFRFASLDVRKAAGGLDPIDEAAFRIVQELARADIKDRKWYRHYSRVFFKEYCESFKNFQDCVLQTYRKSSFLVKNTCHLRVGIFLLYLLIPVLVGFLFFTEMSAFPGVLFCALLGLIAAGVEVSNLNMCGELNAEGVCLRKQLNDEKRWCTLFAKGKVGGSLSTADLIRVSVYAAACDCLTEFTNGLACTRNTSSLALVPGMQLVVPRNDDKRGRCTLAMYVESVLFGLETAESIADSENTGKILGAYSQKMGKELLIEFLLDNMFK